MDSFRSRTGFDRSFVEGLLADLASGTNAHVKFWASNGDLTLEASSQRRSPLCTLIQTTDAGRQRCEQCGSECLQQAVGGGKDLVTTACHVGLPTMARVVSRNDGSVCAIVLCQFLDTRIDQVTCEAILSAGTTLGLSPACLLEAALGMPVLDSNKLREDAARLVEDMSAHRRELMSHDLVYEMGKTIVNLPSLRDSLRVIIEHTVGMLSDSISLGIYVLDPLSRSLRLQAGHGDGPCNMSIEEAIRSEFSAHIDRGLIGFVAEHQRDRYEADVTVDSIKSVYLSVRDRTKSEFDVPLLFQGHLVGVLNAESPNVDGISEDDRFKLTVIARHAAVLIAFAETHKTFLRATEVFQHCETEDELIKTLLQLVTAQYGASFNRAAYLTLSESGKTLLGEFAIGEERASEAFSVWQRLAQQPETVESICRRSRSDWPTTYFQSVIKEIVVNLGDCPENPFALAVRLKQTQLKGASVGNASEPWNTQVPDDLREYLSAPQFVVVPIWPGNGHTVTGVVYADNTFTARTNRAVYDADVALIELLSRQCGSFIALLREREKAETQEEDRTQHMQATFLHTLRTPMTTIVLGCESLLKGLSESPLSPTLHNEIDSLLPQLLDFSQLLRAAVFDPEKDDPKMEMCNLQDILQEVASSNRGYATTRRVELKVEMHETSATVWTDRALVSTVLHTLIKNGIDYADKPDGRYVVVRSESREQGDSVEVIVQDNGMGIDPEIDFRVRWVEIRGPRAEKLNPCGQGVGLYRANKLVQRVTGATLSCQGTKDLGTVFSFRLPTTAKPQPVASIEGSRNAEMHSAR